MPNNQSQAQPSGPTTLGGPESGGSLADKAEQAAAQVTSSAIDRVEQARDRAGQGLEQRREEVAQRIRRVSDALHRMGDELRGEDTGFAQLVDRASERVDSVASYVGSATVRGVSDDVERFARRNPALFFGGAFALGLLAGRFLRSAAPSEGAGGESFGTAAAGGAWTEEPPSRYGDVDIQGAEPGYPGSGEGTGVP